LLSARDTSRWDALGLYFAALINRFSIRLKGLMTLSPLLAGTLSYLAASVLWGLNIPLTSALLQSFDPFWVSPCRYMIAALVLGALVWTTLGAKALRLPISAARLAIMSLSVASFLLLYNLGLSNTQPITAAAITAGAPVYVAVVSRVMTGSRLEKGFFGATLLTLVGAGIAIFGKASALDKGFQLQGGEFLLVLAVVSWTVYSILAQRWFTSDTPALRRTYLSSVAAVPWLLLFWMIARVFGFAGEPNLNPSASAWTTLLIASVFCTALATVAWNMGVARLGITTGGMWQNTVPVFAVLISLVFFDVIPLFAQLIGGGVVMVGVLYMQWQKSRRVSL
jgi:drug/metabolite transporter (DMT)-like permease